MKRALFLYAKLNPGLRYIQGMNELMAPLYYMFKTDTDRWAARALRAGYVSVGRCLCNSMTAVGHAAFAPDPGRKLST